MTYMDEIDKWNYIIVSRSILPSKEYKSEGLKCELVGFSDGSSVAYGCVLYLRWKTVDKYMIDTTFLCAKGKVGPIDGNTVSTNELCGALILSRLTWSTLKVFEETEIPTKYISDNPTKLIVDSTTVFSWIQVPAMHYKSFVKNKVIEIPSSNWKYVPSGKNKATYLLSKGCSRDDFRRITKVT